MNRQAELIIKKLKNRGERITAIRSNLIKIFCQFPQPKSIQELLKILSKKGTPANKTTVYRQLEILLQQKIIQEVNFADHLSRYELTPATHHHHLICENCHMVEDVHLKNDLQRQENNIWKKNKFKVLQHSLEFFGLCQTCQK